MAKAKVVAPWVYLGGTSRRYYNPVDGTFLSREGYDKRYGSLARRGVSSFKAGARQTPEELRHSRPARGRAGSSRVRGGSQALSGLRPLQGRLSRGVEIPFYAEKDGFAEFAEGADDSRGDYEDAVKRSIANSKIFAVSLVVKYYNPQRGASGYYTIYTLTEKHSLPDFDELVEEIYEKAYEGDIIGPLTFNVRFLDSAFRKGPSKNQLRIIKKNKAARAAPKKKARK